MALLLVAPMSWMLAIGLHWAAAGSGPSFATFVYRAKSAGFWVFASFLLATGMVGFLWKPVTRLRARNLTRLNSALGLVVLASIAWGFAVIPTYFRPDPPPSDAALIGRFQAHRTDFIQLVRMMMKDGKLDFMSFTEESPPGTLPSKRLGEYRSIMTRCGASDITHAKAGSPFEGTILFTMWTRTRPVGVPMLKGIEYSDGVPGEVVPSLDDTSKLPMTTIYSRKIEKFWYVCFNRPIG